MTLTAGETALTATYKAASLADSVATFELTGEDKLVDAITYTASSEGVSFTKADFVAKIADAYIKNVTVTTTSVPSVTYVAQPEAGKTSIYFTAKDQYGEAIALTAANVSDLKAAVKLNNVPLLSSEISITDIENGHIELKKTLVEGNKVEITLNNKIDDKVVSVGTKTFTVVKGEARVATTVSNLKSVYVNVGQPNDGKPVEDLAAGDVVKLTVSVKDQYGNPMPSEKVRWVVEEGKDLITKNDEENTAIDEASDAEELTFKTSKAGTVQISAFLVSNGEKVTFTKEIGASKLATLTYTSAKTAGSNKEEIVLGTIKQNSGAILTPEMIKFNVVAAKTTVDVTPADVVVSARLRGGDDSETAKDIVIVATSSKFGKYTITPYVGTSFEDAKAIKASATEVTTTASAVVNRIEVAAVATNEFQAGTELVKSVKFFNKHEEQIQVKASALSAVPTSGLTIAKYAADVEGKKTGADLVNAETNVAFLGFTATEAGSSTATIVAGTKTASVSLTAVEAGKVKTITLGSAAASAIKGDKYAPESETDNLVVKDGKTYTLISVSAKDSYDVDVALAPNDLKVVKSGEAADLPTGFEKKFFSDLKGTEVTGTDKGVKYIGIHTTTGATDKTSTISVDTTLGKVATGFTAPTKVVTVNDARALKTLSVTPVSGSAVVGVESSFKLSGVDQYGVKFALTETEKGKLKVEGTDVVLTKGTISEDAILFTLKSDLAGSYNAVVFIGDGATKATTDSSVTIQFSVIEKGGITSVKVQPEVTADAGETKYDTSNSTHKVKVNVEETELTFSAKAFNVDEGEVSLEDDDIKWSIVESSLKDEYGTNVVPTSIAFDTVNKNVLKVTPGAEVATGTIKVRAAILGKTNDMIINVSTKEAQAQTGTYKLATTANGKGDADKSTVIESVVLDKDSAKGKSTVHVIAKDQYGQVVESNANAVSVDFANSQIVTAGQPNNGVVELTAKKAGTVDMIVYIGSETLTVPVTVEQVAVDAAKLVLDQAAVDSAKSSFSGPYANVAAIEAVPTPGITKSVNVITAATGLATVTLTKGGATATVEDLVLSKVAIVETGITADAAVQTTEGKAPTSEEAAVQGTYTLTFTGTDDSEANNTVILGGQTLTLVNGGDAAATATEVASLANADSTLKELYTFSASEKVLTITQKSGKESADAIVLGSGTLTNVTVGAIETSTEGSILVEATSGTAEVNTLTVKGLATAASVAAKIKTAFANKTTGWTVTNASESADVVFTANQTAADKTVTVTVTIADAE